MSSKASFKNRIIPLPQLNLKINDAKYTQDGLISLFIGHLAKSYTIHTTSCNDDSSVVIEFPGHNWIALSSDNVQTVYFHNISKELLASKNIGELLSAPPRIPEFAPVPSPNQEPTGKILFSVIMPVYDRTDYLLQAIESVVNQTYQWVEVVLVFNGSPPETLALIPTIKRLLKTRRFEPRIIELPKAYGSANIPRNIGCYLAHGEYLVFLDSDDWLKNKRFLAHAEALVMNHLKAPLFYPLKVTFRHEKEDGPARLEKGTRPKYATYLHLKENMNFINNSGVIANRAFFLSSEGIDPDMSYCEDYDLFLRLLRRYGHGYAFDSEVVIRQHPDNNEKKFKKDEQFWIKKAQAL